MSIKVRLLADCTATIAGTGADLGTGQSTVFAVLAADVLGIPVDRVRPDLGDSTAPTAANFGGSSSTSTNGPAVQLAAAAARDELLRFAVEHERSPFHGMADVVNAGQIVNEKAARGQIVGGVIVGIGHALFEDVRMEPTGRFANTAMASYLVPANADIPPVDVRFLSYPDGTLSALGARGIGELAIVGPALAIAGAIHNATGERVRELPVTLDKLLD